MALRNDILIQISKNENSIAPLQATVNSINAILNNPAAAPGINASGKPTLELNGVTYVVATLNSELSRSSTQLLTYENSIVALKSQLSLATTVNTPAASRPSTDVTVRSYQHAKKIFVDGNYRLSPKYGFLFYVEFDFNPLITNISNTSAQEMGMIVKSVSLPKFSIDTKTHNAYNRPNIVQNKIKYDPVNISFHDDQADNVRNFWYDYYSYFYRDPDYSDVTYNAPHKYQTRASLDWGYSPRAAAGFPTQTLTGAPQPYQYIQAIRIYSLYQGQFSEYQLVNPTITSFRHGDHSAAETSGLLGHDMTVQFETVKYLNGYTTQDTAGGFIDLHYDTTPSPLGGVKSPPNDIIDLADRASRNVATTEMSLKVTPRSTDSIFSMALNSMTNISALTPINSGGLSIPSLGSLTQGLTNSAILRQRLESAGLSIAGTAASTFANGVTGSVIGAIGPNGQLVASALSNPSAILSAAENMAIQYATEQAKNYVNTQIASITKSVADATGAYIKTNIVTPIGQGFSSWAATNLPTNLSWVGTGDWFSLGSTSAAASVITPTSELPGDIGINNITERSPYG